MNYRLPDNVVFQEVGQDIVLLNLETGTYFGLNETAAEIYRHILEHNDLASVSEAITRFEVDPAQLRADAQALLADLIDNDLIEVVEE